MARKISTPAHTYDESKIKTLSSLEHIRLRTGMYIGRVGDGSDYDDGIYILLKEVIDNAIDEFIMGFGKEIAITIQDAEVTVRDHGRGIPLGKLVDCVSTINTGAKYNDDVFQFSVGLNGVGTKAVNALSSMFTVRSAREGKYAEAVFERGVLKSETQGKTAEPDGTTVRFVPDDKIFETVQFRQDHVERRMRLYTYLNAGLTISYNGTKLVSDGGLLDLVMEEGQDEIAYTPFHFRGKTLEIALTHAPRYSETAFSFVNGQYTTDGGTHLSAFREGILKAVNEYTKKRFDGDDVREGMIGAIAIRLKSPVFESQTKNKLGNTEIRGELVASVRDALVDLFHRNAEDAQKLVYKIEETARLRRELLAVKKLARDRARSVQLRIPQLKDCRLHLNKKRGSGHESMIFITEGQSAAGSLVSCRDVNVHAIFTLKGKPLNVCGLGREAIYKNDELYNLMRGLRVEDDVQELRYGKVILATDADVDGLHIRNLLLTFFLRFFEPLVLEGHVHILETPLFRVRNKQETLYCYSEVERNTAMRKLGRSAEVTRFKGLGEISPHEFKQFIGRDMRLEKVEVVNQHAVGPILEFYMGRNTPERRQYIMNNLVVEVEE
jgi:DNA gyrase/topoisomerase IV subunit B